MHNSGTNLLQSVGIQKIYSNGTKALDDLTFEAEKQQIFCLLGPNGAGKSTAFDILTGRIPRTDGELSIQRRFLPKSGRPASAFSQAGICLQTNSLWDYMTIQEHLRVYATLKGMSTSEITEVTSFLLSHFYMADDAHKCIDALSGGAKRKLCAAIALLAAPELIFLDEPSTAMDPQSRRRLWQLVRTIMLNKQSATILTTHYMQEAECIADKIGNCIILNGLD